MVAQIAYYSVLGKPLVLYMGIITYSLFLFTALIPIFNNKGVWDIRFIWHIRIAKITIGVATIHGLLGLSIYLGV